MRIAPITTARPHPARRSFCARNTTCSIGDQSLGCYVPLVILRDPVHGLVDFEGPDEKTVEALLRTREVQRLRRVRQLGLTSLVFPGAEHSRFSHAIGTAHVMVRLQRRLQAVEMALPVELRLDPEARQDGIAAALLHDLGHGPFSPPSTSR